MRLYLIVSVTLKRIADNLKSATYLRMSPKSVNNAVQQPWCSGRYQDFGCDAKMLYRR